MVKRLTDTGKWNKNWYWNLSSKEKTLWQYLLDTCDHAGFIEINAKRITNNIKEKFSLEQIIDTMSKHIVHINNNKYWIPKFIQFQYTEKQMSTGNRFQRYC